MLGGIQLRFSATRATLRAGGRAGKALLISISLWSLNALAAGPLQRVANTTLTSLPPVPPFGFTATNAFPGVVFTNPVAIVSPPGETNRLFILEKRGRIVVITNLARPTRTVFLDIVSRVNASNAIAEERGLLGLAFHPGYESNRFFYVFYTSVKTGAPDNTNVLARFRTSAANRNRGDPATEVRFITQPDEAENHNGGDLHFGPDGYLYLSLGDEGGAEGQFGNTQKITKDFFSAIIRIDVDKRPGSLPPNPHPAASTNYAIPPDNPFIGATSFNGLTINPNAVRTEFWAVGLRNPWRWSFDDNTGVLYCGDVGQTTREEIDFIEKGKNYGWNYWEGNLQRTNSEQIPPGFVHAPPLLDYPRSAGFAVTGGRVYRGQRMSQLYGAYLYGDYGSGNIWAFRHTGTNVTQNTLLFTDDLNSIGAAGISAFGVDPSNGDMLYADEQNGTNGRIKRIVATATAGAPIPPLLSGTGAFTNLATLGVAPGIVAYDVNVPFWSDHAIKSRWFSLPNTNLTIGFNSTNNWSFPTGTVWIKHFELELTNGVPASRKRLETRFIVRNTNGVYGVTYRWTTPPTNAVLVAEEGRDEPFLINDGGGLLRTQVWHYPSRSECLQCHSAVGGFGVGFNTPQLNRDRDYGGMVTNQLLALSQAGYFDTNLTSVGGLLALAHPTNTSASLEFKARSYLAANCAQCHQPGGISFALWDANISTATANAGILNGALVNNLGDTNNRVIVPGSLSNSVLLTRLSTPSLRMPPLDSTLLDPQGISLITEWIGSLAAGPSLTNVTFADGAVILSGTNGIPNGNYYVLDSTNAVLPLLNWTLRGTGVFDAQGNFAFTNAPDPEAPRRFYRLQLP
jgi:glucose/arabinose dehydrogenase